MGNYSYSVTSTASKLTGNASQPPDRQGTLRRLTISNPQSAAIKVEFYDFAAANPATASPLTTSVGSYVTSQYTSADAYGKYTYGAVSGGLPVLDASGTPVLDSNATFTPPTAAPTGTGLPNATAAESQDYLSTHSVYSLHKFPGVKTDNTTVAANASTALVPFFTVIVPANTVLYSVEGPWMYVSGLVAKSDNASAVTVVAQID